MENYYIISCLNKRFLIFEEEQSIFDYTKTSYPQYVELENKRIGEIYSSFNSEFPEYINKLYIDKQREYASKKNISEFLLAVGNYPYINEVQTGMIIKASSELELSFCKITKQKYNQLFTEEYKYKVINFLQININDNSCKKEIKSFKEFQNSGYLTQIIDILSELINRNNINCTNLSDGKISEIINFLFKYDLSPLDFYALSSSYLNDNNDNFFYERNEAITKVGEILKRFGIYKKNSNKVLEKKNTHFEMFTN